MKKTRGDFLHAGKGKSLYNVIGDSDSIWMEFKDDLTAFNGTKKSSFKGKGAFNRNMTSLVFRYLEKQGLESHWIEDTGEVGMICFRLEMIPLEVVLRNRVSGSTARKFNLSDGAELSEPLVELYYKNDELQDPFISSEQAVAFSFIDSIEEVRILQKQTLHTNKILRNFFNQVHLELIDFKLEFGKRLGGDKGFIIGDEFSCDSCRLWHKETGEKMDKDRFRLDLGRVSESYRQVHELLENQWGGKL